jgi:hypothetical protein
MMRKIIIFFFKRCKCGPPACHAGKRVALVCLLLWLFARMGIKLVAAKSHSGLGEIVSTPFESLKLV